MSYYGGTVTVAGRNLITSLMAGKTIEFTRIMVGSGAMPEGVEPIDMVALVTPVAEGVSSVPTVENGVLSMVVEYRNDLNGGLQGGFWLREFGVFAKTEDTEEILLYYATLGDSPQPVNAYMDNRIDIRRYPISIALELDADVQITYNPGAFITSAEAEELVRTMVQEAVSGVGTAIIKDITIPHTGWTWQEENPDEQGAWDMDEYRYYVDVPVTEAAETQFPNVALHKAALETAKNAGLCPTVQTLAGALRFWAKRSPDEDISRCQQQRGRRRIDLCAARGYGNAARRRKDRQRYLCGSGRHDHRIDQRRQPRRHGLHRRHGIHAGRSLPL